MRAARHQCDRAILRDRCFDRYFECDNQLARPKCAEISEAASTNVASIHRLSVISNMSGPSTVEDPRSPAEARSSEPMITLNVSSSEQTATRHVVLTNLQVLPYLGLSTGFVAIILPYLLAVRRGDVPAWLPYISDAGGDPPQGALFSLGMCLIAVMCKFNSQIPIHPTVLGGR